MEEGPDGRTKAINVTGPGGAAPLVRGCGRTGSKFVISSMHSGANISAQECISGCNVNT